MLSNRYNYSQRIERNLSQLKKEGSTRAVQYWKRASGANESQRPLGSQRVKALWIERLWELLVCLFPLPALILVILLNAVCSLWAIFNLIIHEPAIPDS